MPDRSTKLTVEILGDSSKGVKALRDYEAATLRAQRATSSLATKIRDDMAKVEQAARDAAAANERLGQVGTKGPGLFGSAAKSVAGQGLESAVANRSSVGANVLGQLGGGEQVLGNLASKAAVATAAIALTGAVATKFGIDSVRAFSDSAEAVDRFQDVSGATAEESSKLVAAAQQLGVSSDTLAGGMAKLARNAVVNEDTLRKYGATIVRTSSGTVDMAATFQSVAGAFARLEDPTQRAILANAAFGKSWSELTDVLERGGPQLNQAIEQAAKHAPIFSEEDLQKAKDFQIAVANLKQELTAFQASIGSGLVADLTELANAATVVADKLGGDGGLAGAFKKVLAGVNPLHVLAEVFRGFQTVGGAVADTFGTVGDEAGGTGATLHGMGESARDGFALLHGGAIVGAQDMQLVGDQAEITAGKVTTAAAAFASAAAAFQNQDTITSALISSTGGWLDALDSANGLLTQGADASAKYADAQVRGAQQISDAQAAVGDALDGVAEAQADYARAVEDAGRSVADAQAAYTKAIEDGQQRIADVEEQTSRRIEDAQDRVTAARRRAEDQAISSARRIEDATQAVRDASVAALRESDNPYAALRRRQEAEQDLARAKEDASRDQEDAAQGVSKAEEDLAQTQVDGAKARADAEREAAQAAADAQQRIADANRQAAQQIEAAQKRVGDATDRVSDANGRLDQTTADVARSLDSASRSADGHAVSLQQAERSAQGVVDASPAFVLSMMDRGASIGEINTQVDNGKESIRKLGEAFGIPAPIIDGLIGRLDRVVTDMLYIRDLTPAAYDFAAAMINAGQAFQDSGTRALFDAGILETVGVGSAVPQFAGGGVFRTSGGSGAGLAVLHDGERVLTPEQQGDGGGVVINVYGSVLSERDLAAAIANLDRLGYRTKRAS